MKNENEKKRKSFDKEEKVITSINISKRNNQKMLGTTHSLM